MSVPSVNNRQQLREKICFTALRLFHKRGIRQVKMDDISTALSISKRTLYELYTNKMELLGEVLELQYNMSHERLKRELKKEYSTMDVLILVLKITVEELNKLSLEFLEDLHRYPEALQKLEELEKRNDDQTGQFFEKGVREGYFLPNINFRLMEDIIRILKSQTSLHQQYGIKTTWTTFVRVCLRSICTLKGIEELDAFLDKITTEDNLASNISIPNTHFK